MKKIFGGFILVYLSVNVLAQKTKLMIQTGHQDKLTYLSVCADESKAFSCDIKSFGILWDINTGKKLSVVEDARVGHFDAASSSLFVLHEKGDFDSRNFLKNISSIPSMDHMSFLPNMSFPDQVLYEYQSGFVFYRAKVFNIKKFTVAQMEPGDGVPKTSFDAVAYSSLKGQAAWGRNTYGKKEDNLYFFDAVDGHKLKSVYLDFPTVFKRSGTPDFLSISKDNNTLLAASLSSSKIYLLDFSSGSVLQVLESDRDKDGVIYFAKLSPDGKNALLVMENGTKMINIQTKEIIWEKKYSAAGQDGVSWLNNGIATFNEAGTKIFFASNTGIEVLNSQTGEAINKIAALSQNNLRGLQQTTDKTHLFTLASNKYVINWNLKTGTLEKSVSITEKKDQDLYNHELYKISSDGKKIIFKSGYSDITELNLKDTTQRIKYTTWYQDDKNITNLSTSFDNKYVFTYRFLEEKIARATPQPSSIYDMSTHTKLLDIPSIEPGAVFANTKNIIATKPDWDSHGFSLYEIPSGKLLNKINLPNPLDNYAPMLFSNTDKYIAIKYAEGYKDGYSLYNPATQVTIDLGGRNDRATTTIAFTPDDKYFLEGKNDGSIKIYLPGNGYGIDFETFNTTNQAVKGIRFSKDAKIMFVDFADNTIKVFDWETRKLLATLYAFPETNDWAVITPDGHFDGTKGAQENMYYTKDLNTIDLSDMYEKFYTPHLLTRILNGEKINKEDVDIDNIHQKPRVKILYAEKIRNLEIGEDNPLYVNTTGLAELTVNATAQDDKIDEIRLFHNGKIVNLATRGLFVTDDKTGKETKKYIINLLPGQNTFRAVALNGQRTESKADEILINYKTEKPAENKIAQNNNVVTIDAVDKAATLYLVVIGINKYQNPKLSLNYALADATAFKVEIEKDARTVLGNVKTFFVTDNTADKKGITDALTEVQKNAKPQDVFVFYYAGHGYISDKTKEFYLVPTDVADIKNVDEELLQKGISSKMLQTYAIDIPAQKQIFILDACQSAGAFEALLTSDANQQKSLAVVARSTGTHWMAASGSKQFAQEFATLKHGAFTYVLLQALQGQAAANKMITVNGLKTFMQVQVPELMKKYNSSPQYPASYGFGNDFPVEMIK